MTKLKVDIKKQLRFYELSIKFEQGNELLVIQGDSGSGKTTTLDIIAGIKKADKGQVLLKDRVLYSDEKNIFVPIRDRNIGYVFQNYALFPNMKVWDNIMFGLDKKNKDDIKKGEMLMEQFGIKHLKKRFPSDISGGEKQRVSLARAMSTNPDLLIMDEPFSALDENLKDKLYKDFLEFKKNSNIPIILITHNNDEAKLLGDRIIHFQEGKIINEEILNKGV